MHTTPGKWYLVFFNVLALSLLAWLFSIDKDETIVVATIDGTPITNTELRYFMLLNKAKAYNHFYRKFDIPYEEGFWNKSLNGQTALEYLRRQSLDAAIRFKVQQMIAKEKGIPTITNFNGLRAERKKVNKKRREKKENGEVVYGPVILSVRNYVSKVCDEMVLKTKNVLSENDFSISKKKMNEMYQAYKQKIAPDLGEGKSTIIDYRSFKNTKQQEYTTKKYHGLVQKMIEQAVVQINKSAYKKVTL